MHLRKNGKERKNLKDNDWKKSRVKDLKNKNAFRKSLTVPGMLFRIPVTMLIMLPPAKVKQPGRETRAMHLLEYFEAKRKLKEMQKEIGRRKLAGKKNPGILWSGT